jgi:hypothetical protein
VQIPLIELNTLISYRYRYEQLNKESHFQLGLMSMPKEIQGDKPLEFLLQLKEMK